MQHTQPETTALAAVDLDAAIVRYVAAHQPCAFADLADLFVDAPAHAPVCNSALQTLKTRLHGLCAAGQLGTTRRARLDRRLSRQGRARSQEVFVTAAVAAPIHQPTTINPLKD
jgi:hypothetical protein